MFYISDQDGGFVNLNLCKVVLDPSFWQCLGKAMEWTVMDKEEGVEEQVYSRSCNLQDGWIYKWHRFIDHLSEGGTIEKYFESLTP
jgi:hypothetical protein